MDMTTLPLSEPGRGPWFHQEAVRGWSMGGAAMLPSASRPRLSTRSSASGLSIRNVSGTKPSASIGWQSAYLASAVVDGTELGETDCEGVADGGTVTEVGDGVGPTLGSEGRITSHVATAATRATATTIVSTRQRVGMPDLPATLESVTRPSLAGWWNIV